MPSLVLIRREAGRDEMETGPCNESHSLMASRWPSTAERRGIPRETSEGRWGEANVKGKSKQQQRFLPNRRREAGRWELGPAATASSATGTRRLPDMQAVDCTRSNGKNVSGVVESGRREGPWTARASSIIAILYTSPEQVAPFPGDLRPPGQEQGFGARDTAALLAFPQGVRCIEERRVDQTSSP